ncbi:MAG: hypothetical protein NZ899_04535 [Thermoguttaceae bacterium]|nr:hypothetical protein [Thermoguttaceae bacterium]MDW8077853.1 hypothetical protein [Thermoguttaceae bacterium]
MALLTMRSDRSRLLEDGRKHSTRGFAVRTVRLASPLVAAALASLVVGCGEMEGYSRPQVRPERYGIITNPDELARPAAQAPAPTPSGPSQPARSSAPPVAASSPGSVSAPPSPAPSPPPALAPAPGVSSEPPPGYVREKAGVGATGKGNYRPGILTTPLSVYFRAQERIIFESQIPHAMQLYHATNGRYPGSWEEFEREILIPNGIRLPTLPPGHRYHYDPQTGQLMVEKPAP